VNDATGQFHPPSDSELASFRDALRQNLAMPVARRYSGGHQHSDRRQTQPHRHGHPSFG